MEVARGVIYWALIIMACVGFVGNAALFFAGWRSDGEYFATAVVLWLASMALAFIFCS